MSQSESIGATLIILLSAVALIGIFFVEPLAQDLNYHQFSDTRRIWGLPNFFNVVSNLPFLLVGISGVYLFAIKKTANILGQINQFYLALYSGVALVGLGSCYYHLQPDNLTLVWDRLPMTISFMAFFSIVIAEFISVKLSRMLFLPFLLAGFGSIGFWLIGEMNGTGDLRPYVLVQFLPIILIPVILVCYRSSFDETIAYWWLLLSYIIAKLLEHFDAGVFEVLGFISGHSLKHIVAAFGLFLLLKSYHRRDYASPSGS